MARVFGRREEGRKGGKSELSRNVHVSLFICDILTAGFDTIAIRYVANFCALRVTMSPESVLQLHPFPLPSQLPATTTLLLVTFNACSFVSVSMRMLCYASGILTSHRAGLRRFALHSAKKT